MLYVGIDCGTHTGVAVWDTKLKRLTAVRTLPLYAALEYVDKLHKEHGVCVVFEDARQRRWFEKERSNGEYRGHLMGAGSVKRDSAIWEQFCKGKKIAYEAIPPRPGMTKWSPEAFAALTGWTGRTSEHARDAVLLVYAR